MKRLTVTSLATACLLVAAALPAQIEPAPFVTVHYDTIDPAQSDAWNENNKEWVEAFQKAKAGEEHYWRAYQSGFTYAWVSDLPNYAYLDDNQARQKALGEKLGEGKMEELMAGGSAPIIEHHTEIWKFEPDLSYWPENLDLSAMNAINVSVDSVKPDKGEDFRALVKDAVAAMKKIEADVNWFAYSIPFGRGSYAFVTWGENRAALHGGPEMGKLLNEAVGSEATEGMFDQWLSSVASTQDRDWRVRRDLAYVSDEPMEKKAMEEASE